MMQEYQNKSSYITGWIHTFRISISGSVDEEKERIQSVLNVHVGNYIIIESKSSNILKTSFIDYIMPLILMIVGIKVFEILGYANFKTLG